MLSQEFLGWVYPLYLCSFLLAFAPFTPLSVVSPLKPEEFALLNMVSTKGQVKALTVSQEVPRKFLTQYMQQADAYSVLAA